jgi:type II secretory pathway pseudopilin PulG
LIELIVVMAIIAILISLLIPAVQRIRKKADIAVAFNDIGQLSNAIGQFNSTYNVSFLTDQIAMTAGDSTSANFLYLKRIWPRLQAANVPTETLTSGQSLVFFLGGISHQGFYQNAQNPFSGGGTQNAPFFTFPTNRLNSNGEFVDPWGNPYVYFTAHIPQSYSLASVHGTSYLVDPNTNLPLNPQSFQIMSAGPDGMFGTGGSYSPGLNFYGPGQPGADDISNLRPVVLGAPY